MIETGTWMKEDETAKQVALIVDQFMAQWPSREWKAPDAPDISRVPRMRRRTVARDQKWCVSFQC
jgi:hypothetical protein